MGELLYINFMETKKQEKSKENKNLNKNQQNQKQESFKESKISFTMFDILTEEQKRKLGIK
jgi:Spy/CpxP family protein refolding chaperone